MPHALRTAAVLALIALAPRSVGAEVDGEPGSCSPPCRSGYFCKAGKCVSLCNPPCGYGERCVKGECETAAEDRPDRDNYLAVLGVFHGGLNADGGAGGGADPSDGAVHMGEIRVEFGGKYTSFEMGPAFGKHVLALRSAIQGHVPFQPFPGTPLYIVPTIAIGYSFGWVEDGVEGHQQDIFITPGVHLRYDFIPRLALLVSPMQLEITFLRLYSAQGRDVERVDVVPVSWNLALGLAFLY
jgi:hypothetical protein